MWFNVVFFSISFGECDTLCFFEIYIYIPIFKVVIKLG